MSFTPHRLLSSIPKRLRLQPRWFEHDPDGTQFVVTETGCWLSLVDHHSTLHVEVRTALGVHDADTAVAFCDDRNQFALVGRWLYDSNAGVVALVADLPLRSVPEADLETVATEVVAEMINAVSTVQDKGAVQRDLNGRKAVSALRGKVRNTRNRTDEHLPCVTYPRGATADVAESTLILTQDALLEPLLDWAVEHQQVQTVADHEDGSRLLLQVAQHPYAGWGLVVSLRPLWTADPGKLNELNARSQVGLGRWTTVHDWVEHRTFLPNALLEAAGSGVWAPAQLVLDVIASQTAQRTDIPHEGKGLQRPIWPGDGLGAGHARRDPWNDAREENDPEWYAIYLDTFGRMGTLTEPSYRSWVALLHDEDRRDQRTAGFITFMEARLDDHRLRQAISNNA